MRKTVKILGTLAALGTAIVTGLGRFSNLLGILGLPDEVKEALVLMSGAPTIVPIAALLIGLFCAGYLVYDSGHHQVAWGIVKGRASRVEHSHLIVSGLIIVVAGVVIGATMIGIGLWLQSKAPRTSTTEQPAAEQPAAQAQQVPPAAQSIPILTTDDVSKILGALAQMQSITNDQVRPAYEATQNISLKALLAKGGAAAVIARLQPIRDSMRQARKDFSRLLYDYRYYDAQLRPAIAGYDSALDWMDGSLTPIIDDLNKYSSSSADVLEALVRERFGEWANGIGTHFVNWYGGVEFRIATETKKIRQWPRIVEQPGQARAKQLSRTDYEKRSRLIIDVFQLTNTQVRAAFDDLWGIYNDQPRQINSNQKGVYDTMVSARAKLIEADKAVGPLVRESELYPDIRGLNWNFQSPILQRLNELINTLRVPVQNGTIIFIDSKETDQLKQGIDVLGKWIEDTKAALAKIKESDDAAVIVAAIDSRDKTFTPGIGTPPRPERVTIQWNEIFGTTRAIDRVFALFLDGNGPESKSIKLKRAYLESAKTGEVIEMKVAGETAVDEAFPISEANPIPPNGFIRLVAVMNPSDNPKGTQNGLLNREFLDRWSSIWFNAIYEDGTPPDRISFDTAGYFPEISGPHATRRPDAKKE